MRSTHLSYMLTEPPPVRTINKPVPTSQQYDLTCPNSSRQEVKGMSGKFQRDVILV